MDYNKVQPIIELYYAIQSEGKLSGIPHIIVRTTGCPLRCYFGEGGFCDTWYSSWKPDKGKYTLNDVASFFREHKHINHLMMTGGGPTMHPELVNEIHNIFKEVHYLDTRTWDNINKVDNGESICVSTIETEGSLPLVTDIPFDLITLSPKFSNSSPVVGVITPSGKPTTEAQRKQHESRRMNHEAITQLMTNHTDYQFKPVVNPIEQPEIWQEILEFAEKHQIPKSKTWIMVPGDTKDELLRQYAMILEFCADNGYNFSGRDHIVVYGDKKMV